MNDMDRLNAALAELRPELGEQTPRITDVRGSVVAIGAVAGVSAEVNAASLAYHVADVLRSHGLTVIDPHAYSDPHVSSLDDYTMDVVITGYTAPTVDIEFNPGTEWGYTRRGHTFNTMWNCGGFVSLELSDGWSFTLPVKREEGSSAIERSVRRALALHYRMIDMRDASESDRESFVETGDDVPSFWDTHDLPVPAQRVEPEYTAHMAQPGQPTCGPLLFCAPPVNDFSPDHF